MFKILLINSRHLNRIIYLSFVKTILIPLPSAKSFRLVSYSSCKDNDIALNPNLASRSDTGYLLIRILRKFHLLSFHYILVSYPYYSLNIPLFSFKGGSSFSLTWIIELTDSPYFPGLFYYVFRLNPFTFFRIKRFAFFMNTYLIISFARAARS